MWTSALRRPWTPPAGKRCWQAGAGRWSVPGVGRPRDPCHSPLWQRQQEAVKSCATIEPRGLYDVFEAQGFRREAEGTEDSDWRIAFYPSRRHDSPPYTGGPHELRL